MENQHLLEQIERRIAAWLNCNNIDGIKDTPDFKLAKEVVNRKLPWTENGVMLELPSISEILTKGKTCKY